MTLIEFIFNVKCEQATNMQLKLCNKSVFYLREKSGVKRFTHIHAHAHTYIHVIWLLSYLTPDFQCFFSFMFRFGNAFVSTLIRLYCLVPQLLAQIGERMNWKRVGVLHSPNIVRQCTLALAHKFLQSRHRHHQL